MRKMAWTMLVAITAAFAGASAQEASIDAVSQAQLDREHTQWIDHVMRSISTVKPGMTRGDLLRVFAPEGGLSTRTQRRYAYKQCPYINVDVEFIPVDDADKDSTTEKRDDRIVKVSRPYLEYSAMD
jgi:hypothetical protein